MHTIDDLHDIDINRNLYHQLSSSPNKTLLKKVNKTCKIYVSDTTLFCLDDLFQLVTYEMKFSIGANKFIGVFVYDISVYRDHSALIAHLPTEMFFDYLLHNYHTVLMDSKHPWDGQRFWGDRINNAFERSLNVYYFDFSNNKLQKMNSISEWLKFFQMNTGRIWGKSDLHQMKRMIITDKVLE